MSKRFWTPGILFSMALLGFFSSADIAAAQCDPRTFMVMDTSSIQINEQTELAFVLTSTRDQWNQAKQSIGTGGSYGLISGFANFDQSKAAALRLAQSTRFDYKSSYALNYLSLTLSGRAQQMYSECLSKDKEKQGIAVWLEKREGDFFFLNAFWVGRNPDQLIGEYDDSDKKPSIVDGVLGSWPKQWNKGKTEQIIFRKKPEDDTLLVLKIGGETKGFVAVHDPEVVEIKTYVVSADKPIIASSNNINSTQCPGTFTEGCVVPKKPGGYLRIGSGNLANYTSSAPSASSWSVTVNTPESICIRLNQSTGACETKHTASGTVTAIEHYPDLPPTPAR